MNRNYFYIFLFFLLVEIAIAFSKGFVRHTLGDFFAVILLYSFIRTFTKLNVNKASLFALGIAFLIEFLQLANIVDLFPKKGFNVLILMLGSTFSIFDLIAYTLGILCVLFIESKRRKHRN